MMIISGFLRLFVFSPVFPPWIRGKRHLSPYLPEDFSTSPLSRALLVLDFSEQMSQVASIGWFARLRLFFRRFHRFRRVLLPVCLCCFLLLFCPIRTSWFCGAWLVDWQSSCALKTAEFTQQFALDSLTETLFVASCRHQKKAEFLAWSSHARRRWGAWAYLFFSHGDETGSPSILVGQVLRSYEHTSRDRCWRRWRFPRRSSHEFESPTESHEMCQSTSSTSLLFLWSCDGNG